MAYESDAHAQDAPPLTSRDFKIDMAQGPVISNSRVLGMGGAFTGVAEGTAGLAFNPASVAHRPYFSFSRFDWDFEWDIMVPGIFQGDDFDFYNSGVPISDEFIAFALGIHGQYNELGVGVFWQGQNVDFVDAAADPRGYTAKLSSLQLAVGYGLWDHRIVVGASFLVGIMSFAEAEALSTFAISPGFGGTVGAVYRPKTLPLRIGLTFVSPLASAAIDDCEGEDCPEDLFLPSGIASPWKLHLGAAWQFSFDGQQFNPYPAYHYPDAHAEDREQGELERAYKGGRYLLVAADVHFTGAVDNAIGLTGFFTQTRLVSGEAVVVSPRLGVETEIIPRRLRLRGGTYWEPARQQGRSGRIHGTTSLQLRMFDIKIPLIGWRGLSLSTAFDWAESYSNASFSIFAFWY